MLAFVLKVQYASREEELAREAAQHVEDLQRELARADAGSYDGAESSAGGSLSTPTDSMTGNQPALSSRQTGDSTAPTEDGTSTTGRLFRRLLMPFQAQFRMATAVAQHAVGDVSSGGGVKEEAAPEARATSDAVVAVKTRAPSLDDTKIGDKRRAPEKQAPSVDAAKVGKQRRASEKPVSLVDASKGAEVKQVAEPKKAAKPIREELAELPPLTEAALVRMACGQIGYLDAWLWDSHWGPYAPNPMHLALSEAAHCFLLYIQLCYQGTSSQTSSPRCTEAEQLEGMQEKQHTYAQ